MSTLLLRLAGPMQSWGLQSRFDVRDTGREPTKSGVIGLLCAALGRPRAEPVADLAALRMGVRVDREGLFSRDYHTASDVVKAGGGMKDCEPSTRYYLADADFVVGLEGDEALLRTLEDALPRPVWPLCLGRKAFVPGVPVYLVRHEGETWVPAGLRRAVELREALALESVPWRGGDHGRPVEPLRLVLDDPAGSEVRPDVPLSFATRRFATRRVRTDWLRPEEMSEEG